MKLTLDLLRPVAASLRWLAPLALILLAFFTIIFVLLIKVPELYYADWALADDLTTKDLLQRQNEMRSSIATVLGGTALLVGLYLTYRNLKLTQETAQNTQKTAQENLRLTEEGKITDRFSKAIEQLGSDKLQIRLGGIYALERIAKDSARDHWPVMKVLTAFVRDKAPWRESLPSEQSERVPAASTGSDKQEDLSPKVAADVQAALTVIGRRARTYKNGEEYRLDLSGTCLRGADLRGAHLEEAKLREVNLMQAILRDAHLEGAFLRDVNLAGAALDGAHLERASLYDVDLGGADLSGIHLEGADLGGVEGITAEWLKPAGAVINLETKLPVSCSETEQPNNDDTNPPVAGGIR
jgi:hypothetical protein